MPRRKKTSEPRNYSIGAYEITIKGPKDGFAFLFESADGRIEIGAVTGAALPRVGTVRAPFSGAASAPSRESGDPAILAKPGYSGGPRPAGLPGEAAVAAQIEKRRSMQEEVLDDFGLDPQATIDSMERIGNSN